MRGLASHQDSLAMDDSRLSPILCSCSDPVQLVAARPVPVQSPESLIKKRHLCLPLFHLPRVTALQAVCQDSNDGPLHYRQRLEEAPVLAVWRDGQELLLWSCLPSNTATEQPFRMLC